MQIAEPLLRQVDGVPGLMASVVDSDMQSDAGGRVNAILLSTYRFQIDTLNHTHTHTQREREEKPRYIPK